MAKSKKKVGKIPSIFHWGATTIEQEADSYYLAKLLDEQNQEENERKSHRYEKQWLF